MVKSDRIETTQEGRRKQEDRSKKAGSRRQGEFSVFRVYLAWRFSGYESRGEVAAERLKVYTRTHTHAQIEDRPRHTPNCSAPALLLLWFAVLLLSYIARGLVLSCLVGSV